MMHHLHDRPITRYTLETIDRIVAAVQYTHAAMTSDRAQSLYRTIGRTIATTVLLSIASVLLLVDAGKAIHRWAQAHQDWTYEDFEKTVADEVQAVAATVKRFVKGQRDRALSLVQETAADLEMQSRARVSRLGLMISEKASPVCGVEGCK